MWCLYRRANTFCKKIVSHCNLHIYDFPMTLHLIIIHLDKIDHAEKHSALHLHCHFCFSILPFIHSRCKTIEKRKILSIWNETVAYIWYFAILFNTFWHIHDCDCCSLYVSPILYVNEMKDTRRIVELGCHGNKLWAYKCLIGFNPVKRIILVTKKYICINHWFLDQIEWKMWFNLRSVNSSNFYDSKLL